jgi:hypothetical protein
VTKLNNNKCGNEKVPPFLAYLTVWREVIEDLKKIPLKKIAEIGISTGNLKFPKIEFSFILVLDQ